MSWDLKERGRKYYYRSHRINGKQTKVYVGTGLAGERAEAEDREARIRRNTHRHHWFCIESQISELSESSTQLAAISQLMTRVVMVANGMYLHRGHEWRKRARISP